MVTSYSSSRGSAWLGACSRAPGVRAASGSALPARRREMHLVILYCLILDYIVLYYVVVGYIMSYYIIWS